MLKFQDFVSSNRYKITRGWLGPFRLVIGLHHPELIRKALKMPKAPNTYRMLKPWLGDGLLISSGAKWYRNRRLLTSAFHFEILKPYISVYNSCVEVFLDKCSIASKKKEPVELFDTISLLSLDIILQCAFSFKSNCQHVGTKHVYIKAVYDLVDLISRRFLNLFYRMDWFYRLTSDGKKFKEACSIVHKHSEKVIMERREALAREETTRKTKRMDFLDTLLTAVDAEGNGLTDREIRDEADTFMFEGHDTTTSGMVWTLYCLAQHPEHQEKVREEVQEVLMGRERLEYSDLQHLKYTQMAIKEAMRLYPPVIRITRVTTEEIELDGVTIPKGVNINLNIQSMHRNQAVWEDPLVYDPMRFHPSNEELHSRDPMSYLPFSAGSRNCIGQNFALNEEKVVIASFVRKFSFSLDKDHKVEMNPGIVLRSRNDIKLLVEEIH